MIINTNNNSVEVVGDITEFKTGIDPKNLELITTLLSSNLYSAPERSFIREIVSNAWDSHVEAGTTDTPVIVKLDRENHSISIRDFGTGLSPERFKDVYCNIGSSTKRSSNDFIGGFGIGKYSALACTDTVYITSYYEGFSYHYIMIKNGTAITTNLVATLPTTEKNGVEVTIKDILRFDNYKEALNYIIFFPNVYIDGYNKFNETRIKNYNNYACATQMVEYKLLLGNVLYPCDTSMLSFEGRSFINDIKYSGVVIKFKVGELNITPNRESIIYTNETKKIIEDRILAAKEEMYNNCIDCMSKDYDNIWEYAYSIKSLVQYNPFNNSVLNKCIDGGCSSSNLFSTIHITININDIKSKITYKGKDLSESVNFIRQIGESQIPTLKCIAYNNKLFTNVFTNYYVSKLIKTFGKDFKLIKSNRLSALQKSFIKDNLTNIPIITGFSLDTFRSTYPNLINSFNYFYITEEIYNCIMSHTSVLDFDTDKLFLAYKDKIKNEQKSIINTSVILYIIKHPEGRQKRVFSTFDKAVNYIKKEMKCGIIFDYIQNDNKYLIDLILKNKFAYITANKNVISALKSLYLTNEVSYDDIFNSKKIRAYYTIEKYSHLFPLSKDLISILPTDIASKFKDLSKIWTASIRCFIPEEYKSKIKEDPYIISLIDKYQIYYKSFNDIKEELQLYPYTCIEHSLLNFIIMKKKVFRIGYSCYKELKQLKYLNYLCKK